MSYIPCPFCTSCIYYKKTTARNTFGNTAIIGECQEGSSVTAACKSKRDNYKDQNDCKRYKSESTEEEQKTPPLVGYRSSLRRGGKIENQSTRSKTDSTSNDEITPSPKNWWITFFLCLVLGVFGIHRFYTGRIASGFFMFLTLGGVGVWIIVDLVLLILKKYTDSEGKYIIR